jgi:predicted ester cyclase
MGGETRQFVEQNLKSWNAHDKTAWTRDISDDADVAAPGGVSGKGRELKAMFYAMWTDAFPDNKITPNVIATDGENAMLEATFEGTHTGPLNAPTGTIQPTRKRVKVPFVTVTKIRDGKFASLHLYFDQVELMSQLGLMPAPARA